MSKVYIYPYHKQKQLKIFVNQIEISKWYHKESEHLDFANIEECLATIEKIDVSSQFIRFVCQFKDQYTCFDKFETFAYQVFYILTGCTQETLYYLLYGEFEVYQFLLIDNSFYLNKKVLGQECEIEREFLDRISDIKYYTIECVIGYFDLLEAQPISLESTESHYHEVYYFLKELLHSLEKIKKMFA